MDHANAARPVRNLAVDFYRVSGVALIVLGHWLDVSLTYHDGNFGWQDPLVDLPWTQWLTWIFQAVPVFFLAAGYASAVSWTHRRHAEGFSRRAWLQYRLARVLGPIAVYVGLASVIVLVLDAWGVAGSALEYMGWLVAMHLWFLVVYLMVVSLTPIAVAAQRRWGLLVPAGLAVAVVAVDAVSVSGYVPHLGRLNHLLCWATLYQLGIAWHSGLLAGRRPLLLATGSAGALALLIWLGLYPVDMIENSSPPTVALLAFACIQVGVAVAVAPVVSRALRRGLAQRVLSNANRNVMSLYLWHMMPVIIVALVGFSTGLLPQPIEGTTQWGLARLEWVVILGMVTAVEMTLLWWQRRIFAAPLPTLRMPLPDRWAEPVMLAGTAMAAYGLWFFAKGFEPAESFPGMTALISAVGLVLVAFRPAEIDRRSVPDDPLRMQQQFRPRRSTFLALALSSKGSAPAGNQPAKPTEKLRQA